MPKTKAVKTTEPSTPFPSKLNGKYVGKTVSEVSGRVDERLGEGNVELYDVDEFNIISKEGSGHVVKASQPFTNPIAPSVFVLLDDQYLITSVLAR